MTQFSAQFCINVIVNSNDKNKFNVEYIILYIIFDITEQLISR